MTKAFKAQGAPIGARYAIHPDGVATTRGLLIGFAISQILWIGIALLVF